MLRFRTRATVMEPVRYVDVFGDPVRTVQDVPLLIHKTGDVNKTAECCRYNLETFTYNQRLVHQRNWEADVPYWYQVGVLLLDRARLGLALAICSHAPCLSESITSPCADAIRLRHLRAAFPAQHVRGAHMQGAAHRRAEHRHQLGHCARRPRP